MLFNSDVHNNDGIMMATGRKYRQIRIEFSLNWKNIFYNKKAATLIITEFTAFF